MQDFINFVLQLRSWGIEVTRPSNSTCPFCMQLPSFPWQPLTPNLVWVSTNFGKLGLRPLTQVKLAKLLPTENPNTKVLSFHTLHRGLEPVCMEEILPGFTFLFWGKTTLSPTLRHSLSHALDSLAWKVLAWLFGLKVTRTEVKSALYFCSQWQF